MPEPAPIDAIEGDAASGLSAEMLAAWRESDRPVVIRGLAADWPAVAAGRQGGTAVADYLKRLDCGQPVGAIAASPSEKGRFFYNSDATRLNFMQARGNLSAFLDDLVLASNAPEPPAMAVQSEPVERVLPGFSADNAVPALSGVEPRIWIGNAIRVAPHYDVKENVAVCVAGRRRFTLFPPDQIGNLYPGPLELTPAGTPVSMVNLAEPDLTAHPRYAEAARHAQAATLEPGDAIYIPYCWWHGVQSLDPVSVLVNYWWTDAAVEGSASPYDALLHAMMAFRNLDVRQRAVWRGMLDHYAFEANGDPGAHLPPVARGVLARPTPQVLARMRQRLLAAFSRTPGPGRG